MGAMMMSFKGVLYIVREAIGKGYDWGAGGNV
jgi:hypothetical protein